MAKPSPAHVEVAERLLAEEGAGGGNVEGRAAAAGRVYDELFDSLAPLIGVAGFLALFARSVKLTQPEFPCLKEVQPGVAAPESNIQRERFVSCLNGLEPAAALEVSTALFATFFGLTTTFIGERLVWQVLKSGFPSLAELDRKDTE